MAKKTDVELLCAGVAVWNRSRESRMDLSHVEIRNADVSGADFTATDFDGTRIINSNLSGCSFKKARFNGVSATMIDMAGCDFTNGEIKGTDLSKCRLADATFHQIESYQWKVRHSSFARSTIEPVKLAHAHFYNCDFTECSFEGEGISFVDMKRPEISLELEKSLEKLGIHFELVRQPNVVDWPEWRNLNLPEGDPEDYGVVIHDYEAYWINEKRWDIFVSYQSTQLSLAEDLARELETHGLRVWFDARTLLPSDSLSNSIDVGLSACPFGVAILSAEYFGRRWTEYELDKLLEKRMFIILHNVSRDVAVSKYARLDDRIMLRSDLGVELLAEKLVDGVRRPPRTMVK